MGLGTNSPTDTGGYGQALDITGGSSGAAIYLRASNGDTGQIALGSADLTIRTRQADPILFSTNNSERVRITSTGVVGIATDSPAGKFDVHGSGSSAIIKARRLDGNGGYNLFEGYSDVNAASTFYVSQNGVGYFHSRVNIGTSDAGYGDADDLNIASSTHTGMTIRSGTSSLGTIAFSDGTSGTAEYKGFVQYNHSQDTLHLGSSHQSKATINADGNTKFVGIVTATEFVPTLTQLSHKNLIINGAMQVSQRSTTSTESDYATVDRFKIFRDGVDENPTQSRHTLSTSDTPYSFGFRDSYHITNGNQTSVGADDTIVMQTRLEAQDIANSGWNYTDSNSFITFSYWVKSSVSQTFYNLIRSIDGTAQMYDFPFALTANTWQKVTHSIPGNSNLTFDDNNGLGLLLEWTIFRGTNDSTSSHTSNAWAAYSGTDRIPDMTNTWYDTDNATFEITGVQLEVGSQSTPFEHRPFSEVLKQCHRYFYKTNRWMGGTRGSGNSRSFHLDFGMRLTGNDVSSGTYINDGTAGGDVVYIGSNATRQASDVTANSLGASTSSNTNHMSLSVSVGYTIGSGDNGIVTGLYIGGFSIDHEI